MVSALMSLHLLEDKLRHIQIPKSLFEQNGIGMGSTKSEVPRHALSTAAGKTYKVQKRRKKIVIGSRSQPRGLFVTGRPSVLTS